MRGEPQHKDRILMRESGLPPNQGLQRTALGAHKIGAILKSGINPSAFPIYECAAAEAQAVGRLHQTHRTNTARCSFWGWSRWSSLQCEAHSIPCAHA